MDIADTAQEISSELVESSLKKRKSLTIPFSGFCLSCEEPVEDRRYCDGFCREDHEKALVRKMRS